MAAKFDLQAFFEYGHGQKILWAAIAAFGLLALWNAWGGWQIMQGNARIEAAERAGASVRENLQAQTQALLERMEQVRARPALATALRAGDAGAAQELVRAAWSDSEAVEIHASDLNVAYADPVAFGYGKLGLLERVNIGGNSALAVVRDRGQPRLAVAGAVVADGETIGLVYVTVPLAPVLESTQSGVPVGAYLGVQQGRYTIVETGETGLREDGLTVGEPLPEVEWRIRVATPSVEKGPFDAGALGAFGVAGVGLLLAAFCAVLPALLRKRASKPAPGEEVEDTGGATLAELISSGRATGQRPAMPPLAGAPAPAAAPAAKPAPPRPTGPRVAIERSIFRAYDIRGVVGKSLDAGIARLIGQAVGSVMHERGVRSLVVGRDGRLSSPELTNALIDGLRAAGREVIDVGQVPTPLVYFAAFHLRTGSGIMVTGSHNPGDYNGFKIVVEGEALSGDAVQGLYARIAENRLHQADQPGTLNVRSIVPDYVQRIADDIQIERKLKVVVDAGSGVAGVVAPQLLEAIGAEVEPLYCEVDGSFPFHHPDPGDPANLRDLIQVVQRSSADLGIAFDGDGDRLGVVTREGEIIYPDRLLMLYAADVLERNPGACVIYDVKCTGDLATFVLRHGGSPLMWKTGHSLIKAKMKASEAELAGEMSGHFFFRERWYGFDDGLYAACRLLEILAARVEGPEQVFAELPKATSTPEIKVAVEEGEQFRFIERFVAQAKFDGARIATIDGLRADWADGWGLVRASNTTPSLVLRFEGRDEEVLGRIQAAFREQMLAIEPGLSLPF
jgi:phosphomannomutase/phosphoglucomutase